MKNSLRYIFAIPLGIIVSMTLPKWFMFIFKRFIPFDFVTDFIQNYLLTIFAGWIAVGFVILIVPKRKILFAIIQIAINFISAIYWYKISGDFNYLFLIGGFLVLGMYYLKELDEKKQGAEKN